MKYQTRCPAAFPDQQGFLVGSIEGRVGVHRLDDDQQSKNFTFKCHREGTGGSEIYSVNALNFHPVHHTFSASGSDGSFHSWDKDSKQRPKNDGSFHSWDNNIFILLQGAIILFPAVHLIKMVLSYASCYDRSKGAEIHNPATAKTYIYLHSIHIILFHLLFYSSL